MWQPVTYVTHTEFSENKIELCDLKGTFYLIPIAIDAIIYKSSLYTTSWTFRKNNFDLLWHYIRYITKRTPYKIKILTVVVYFYSFPACYLRIYLHWVFSTFNYLSNKVNLKPLSFVVCLQQFIKHINPQVQHYHLNVVTHKSTVARTVMCRQDGRGRFPVLFDDHSKCRTNSQRKSQLS